jgi:SAM-dependent methyltransferase
MGKDLFSGHAQDYAAFRPTYPKQLYDFLLGHVKNFDQAWDAGTGNGQVARDLSNRFKKVFATDISAKQIENAFYAENIFYYQSGETTSFSESSFDLITVAQAIHWFDRGKFYAEVARVAKPEAVIAVWGYSLLSVDPEIDLLINDFYKNIIGPYWDKERKLIDEHYTTISFPFQEIITPEFSFSFQWTLPELQGYLNTWSSVQKFVKEKNNNPVEKLIDQIEPLWKWEKMEITFPLFLKAGNKSSIVAQGERM